MIDKSLDTQNTRHPHPAQEEIQKCIGIYNFTAVVEKDVATLQKFRHIPGLISFICTIRKGDLIVGEGRGTAVLSRINRYIERTVRFAFNASLLDATAKSLKMLDALQLDVNNQSNGTTVVKQEPVVNNTKLYITPKQKGYILELVKTRVKDIEERNRWQNTLDKMTRDEASLAIQSLSSK